MSVNIKRFFKICVAVFALEQSLCASDIMSNDQVILINNDEVGQLFKGTEVIKNGDKYKVRGYVMTGNEYMLFYSNENKIKLGTIKEEFTNKYKVIAEKQDVYGVKWKEVELDFNLRDVTKVVQKNNGIWSEEEALYARCGSCHAAFSPEEYTVNQWPNVLKTMSERAGLTKNETKAVGTYLQYKALEMHQK